MIQFPDIYVESIKVGHQPATLEQQLLWSSYFCGTKREDRGCRICKIVDKHTKQKI